jgi:hypothetical protein
MSVVKGSGLVQIGKEYFVFSGDQKVKKAYYICECGKIFSSRVSFVKSLRTKSCGCLRIKIISKHNKCTTKEYKIWQSMKSRCSNSSYAQYKDYGGRGIKVSNEWLSFEKFFEDMGEAPIGLSIDRINNDGDYCKENCRWASKIQQARNQRSNRLITIGDKTECLKFWSESLGVPVSTFYSRIAVGKTELEALGIS